MSRIQHEIVVLKPTAVFLSFLASQLPETKLPDLRLLQIDNTAYVLPKKSSDDATLAEIEKYFSKMFRHEICRWLGDKARHDIETHFLDFLCCFKVELRNHIVLMESSIDMADQLLLIKPRLALLNWFKSTLKVHEDLAKIIEKVELTHMEEKATVVVKNFANLMEIKPFIKQHYKSLVTPVMCSLLTQCCEWPVIDSFHDFSQYFAIEIHTQLIHLNRNSNYLDRGDDSFFTSSVKHLH